MRWVSLMFSSVFDNYLSGNKLACNSTALDDSSNNTGLGPKDERASFARSIGESVLTTMSLLMGPHSLLIFYRTLRVGSVDGNLGLKIVARAKLMQSEPRS
eukprot:SAG11_NODE_7624_length_1119_cov_2.145098_2_plen_101_part_00